MPGAAALDKGECREARELRRRLGAVEVQGGPYWCRPDTGTCTLVGRRLRRAQAQGPRVRGGLILWQDVSIKWNEVLCYTSARSPTL